MTFLLNCLKSIIFGILQGITEWLPISSTGHLILLQQFMPLNVYSTAAQNQEFWDIYKVVIQFGSILAVVMLYWKKLWPFSSDLKPVKKRRIYRLWILIVIASIPLVLGVLLDDWIDNVMSTPYVIAVTLILYGVIFIWMESRPHTYTVNKISEITPGKAFKTGLFQTLAMIPGTSRSGSTIMGATLLGFNRPTAAEFSFYMAIPAMLGASLLKIIKADIPLQVGPIVILLIGTVVAFLVSIFAIRYLMRYIRQHDFKVFGVYRIILGIIVLICTATGLIG